MIQGHGGNIYALAKRLGCRPEDIMDVSSNINPQGPPPGLLDYLKGKMGSVCALPEVDSNTVSIRIASEFNVAAECVLAGAGTTQFIYSMFDVLRSQKILIIAPTYADYGDACRISGLKPDYFLVKEDDFLEVREYCNIHGLWKTSK